MLIDRLPSSSGIHVLRQNTEALFCDHKTAHPENAFSLFDVLLLLWVGHKRYLVDPFFNWKVTLRVPKGPGPVNPQHFCAVRRSDHNLMVTAPQAKNIAGNHSGNADHMRIRPSADGLKRIQAIEI
jgi:hypothetical protein